MNAKKCPRCGLTYLPEEGACQAPALAPAEIMTIRAAIEAEAGRIPTAPPEGRDIGEGRGEV